MTNTASTDLAQFTPSQQAQDAGLFVAVGTDKDTGRAIIALDAAAVDALTYLLDNAINSDDYMYPDSDDATRAGVVASAICRPLLKLQGF